MIFIAVIGGSSVNKKVYKTAVQVGREIAAKKAGLVCGGLGGVMEGACKGAQEKGGLTVGILPGKTRDTANEYIDIAVPTGMSEARNAVIINMADAVIAVDGKEGTLSEIAFALKQKKPISGIDTHDIKGIIKAVSAKEAVKEVFKKLRG